MPDDEQTAPPNPQYELEKALSPLLHAILEEEKKMYYNVFTTFDQHAEQVKQDYLSKNTDYMQRLVNGIRLLAERFKK